MSEPYDPALDTNRYPRVLYRGEEYQNANSLDEEKTMLRDGWSLDPPARVPPKTMAAREGGPRAAPVAPDAAIAELKAEVADLKKRIEAIEGGTKEAMQDFDDRLSKMEGDEGAKGGKANAKK